MNSDVMVTLLPGLYSNGQASDALTLCVDSLESSWIMYSFRST